MVFLVRGGLASIRRWLVALLVGIQANAGQLLGRNRRIEAQAHGANRQAGGLCVLAFATEGCGKRLAHLKVEALFNGIGHARSIGTAGGRADALAVDQLHFCRRGQCAVAGQGHDAQGRRGRNGFQTLALDQRFAVFAINQAHCHAFTQTIDLAPHVGLHAGQRRGAIQPQREKLVLVDAGASMGLHALHKRAASVEFVTTGSGQCNIFGRLQSGAHLQATAYARW